LLEVRVRTKKVRSVGFDREFATLVSRKPRTEYDINGITHEHFMRSISFLRPFFDLSFPGIYYSALQKFGGFIIGTDINYAPSSITSPAGQPVASTLVVGQRLTPQIILRAADARPFEIQDLCPSDNRFKILLFLGDLKNSKQAQRVSKLAADMSAQEGFLSKFGRCSGQNTGKWDVFDVLAICTWKKESFNYLDVPPFFRSHWSKYVTFFPFVSLPNLSYFLLTEEHFSCDRVYVDDAYSSLTQGGKAYSSYGIDPGAGAIAVVRPDGYIGAVAALENVSEIDTYFSAFMTPSV
jgi:phenol 2-monooxygenase (NADPH)